MNIKTNMRKNVFILLAFLAALCPFVSADWPWFGGPNLNGISDETGFMKIWPQGGPEILWSVKVGKGYGGVAVHGGKVYLLDRVVGKEDVLRCFDLQNGREEWKYPCPAPGEIDHPGSRSSPAVDKKYIFTLGTFGDLYCFSKETHKPVWKKNIIKEFEGKQPGWAVAQSPALYKNMVIAAPVGEGAGMVAFEKDTGDIVWKSEPFKGGMTYVSPMVAALCGVDQVMIIAEEETVSVDANSGKILWRSEDWTCGIPITSPMAIGDDRVFVTGGYSAGSAMFRIEKKDGKFFASTLYKTRNCNCQIQQPILYKDHLYFNGNDKSYKYGLVCMDLDGNIKWQTKKSPAFEWGGLLLADDMLYVVDDVKGDLCMVKPDPAGYQEMGRVHLLEGDQIWGAIALSDGKILLRDQAYLKCVDVKGSGM